MGNFFGWNCLAVLKLGLFWELIFIREQLFETSFKTIGSNKFSFQMYSLEFVAFEGWDIFLAVQISVFFLDDCWEGFGQVSCFFCKCSESTEGWGGYSIMNLLFVLSICFGYQLPVIHVAYQKPDSNPSSC